MGTTQRLISLSESAITTFGTFCAFGAFSAFSCNFSSNSSRTAIESKRENIFMTLKRSAQFEKNRSFNNLKRSMIYRNENAIVSKDIVNVWNHWDGDSVISKRKRILNGLDKSRQDWVGFRCLDSLETSNEVRNLKI